MRKTETIADVIEQREREQQHLAAALEQAAANRKESARKSASILKDLAGVGFPVASIRDLRMGGANYSTAVPILLKWLPIVEDNDLKESIVFALRIKALRKLIVPPLLDEFENLPEDKYHFVKWQIGDSMTYLADDDAFDRIATLLRDKRHGTSRQMLAVSLGKMKKRAPDAIRLLDQMLAEDDMPGHVMMALRKLNGKAARSNIEHYLSHNMTWVRNEAKKAIAKFDKAE